MTVEQLELYRSLKLELECEDTIFEVKEIFERQIKEIESFVDKIPDKEIRTIIRMRYMIGKRPCSWQKIALKLGYCAEHTPKRKIKKFFEMSEMSDFS